MASLLRPLAERVQKLQDQLNQLVDAVLTEHRDYEARGSETQRHEQQFSRLRQDNSEKGTVIEVATEELPAISLDDGAKAEPPMLGENAAGAAAEGLPVPESGVAVDAAGCSCVRTAAMRRAGCIAATFVANGNFTILVAALRRVDLVEMVSGPGPFSRSLRQQIQPLGPCSRNSASLPSTFWPTRTSLAFSFTILCQGT